MLLFHDLAVDHSTSKPLQYLAQQAAQRLIVIAGEAVSAPLLSRRQTYGMKDRTEAISLLAKEPETDADDLAPRPFSLDDVDLPTLTGTSSRHQEVVAWTSCALLGDRNSEQVGSTRFLRCRNLLKHLLGNPIPHDCRPHAVSCGHIPRP